ncbi:MAG: hypothetical protein JO114_01695 [Planctomycetaceae bacterium]|nr:hypothetical protein [Planctomycetaceae bacterium]
MNKGIAVVRVQCGVAGRLLGAIFFALSALFSAVGAAPPEIIRVHVPAAQATGWFPAGTPLRMMAPDRFESLLDSAIRGTSPAKNTIPPRLFRARHHARWNAGVLTGESRLAAVIPNSGPAALVLDPWTPMILASPRNLQSVGALESGKTVLLIEPSASAGGNPAVTLDWELRARADSGGRSFALGLPGDETTELTLELPAGWLPLGPEGFREGPLPSSQAGFQSWRFHGRPELVNLRLLDGRKPLPPGEESLIWVSGPTRIMLGSTESRDARSANWTTDWTVQPDRRGLMRFTVELGPGLEFIAASGPEVKEYQAEHEGEVTRVRVTLAGISRLPTPLHFEAHARVPLEGLWSVPAMRPLDAIWTGGTTTVVVDPLRVIQDCRERAGRRVPAQGGEPEDANMLVFEAKSADPVADLVFHQTQAQPACQVRGRLLVGLAAPELECQLIGVGGRGPTRELSIELPPTWVADRVRWSGADESLAWHPAIQADGSTRLHVLLPGGENAPEGRALEIAASSTAAGGRGPLVLPRVRPSGLAILDETWVAMVDRTTILTPISAHGLVWIDPSRVEGAIGSKSAVSPDVHAALAWRWNGENAAARVDREQAQQEPRTEIQYRAKVEQDGKHLAVEGQILIKPGSNPLDVLPVWVSQPAGGSQDWSFRAGPETRELIRNPLDDPSRSRLEFPATGLAWNLSLSSPEPGESRVHFKARLPWNQRGSIPLISPPRRFLPRSTVLLEVPSRMRSDVQTAGLRRLETTMAERLAASWQPEPRSDPAGQGASERAYLVAHAFTYTEPGGKLELNTEELLQSLEAGIIRDVCLTTILHPSGPWLNRLRLLLHAEQPADLEFTMPADSRLVRVQLDGADVVPTLEDGRMVVSLQRGSPGLRYKTVDLDYEMCGRAVKPDAELKPVLPQIGMPCLSFCWVLVTPPCWQARSYGSGLLPNDPGAAPIWPFGSLGVPELRWPGREPGTRTASDETLRWLDETLAGTSAEELTFAEWFTRWDSGTTPLIIDRLALSAAGRGPRSRCTPNRVGPRGQPLSLKTLQQYGLTLLRLDPGLVITSQGEAARSDQADNWLRAIGEALLWGSDRTDRFQTAARWRGEITPRDAPAGGSAEPLRALPGWSTWRFTGANWPGEASRVELRDERSGLVAGWTVALLVVLGLIWLRSPSPRWAILLPIAIVFLAVLLHLWQAEDRGSFSAGLFVGAMASLLYRLGSQLTAQRPRERSVPIRSGMTSTAAFRVPLRAAPLLLAVFLIPQDRAEAKRDEEQPIPVLMPYEGTFQPGQVPGYVILRESDHQRLQELAQPRPPVEKETLILTGAVHHVAWSGDQEVSLVSDLELRSTAGVASTWKVPIAGAHDITAALDGREVPVFIEAGGQQAAITIPGAGSFQLQVRRTATVAGDRLAESLDFPVNPMPSARLILDRSSRPRPPRLLNARGKLTAAGNQSLAAELGPVDHVEIRWGDADADGSQVAGTIIEGMVLWDIEPAGDRLRGRFTYRGTRRLSTLSFQMDPGLMTRSVEIPGLIDSCWGGTAERPIWTARMDPPLQEGAVLSLDLWRPVQPSKGGKTSSSSDDRFAGESTRRFPRLEPLGVERYLGVLGLRRPGHWTGRLEPLPDTDPLSDESFVKSWGPLPDDRLTLAGTTRLIRDGSPSLQTGPAVARIKVKPALQLGIDAGRIDVQLDADLDEVGGSLNHLELALPPDLVVLSVESDALTDWSRPDPRQLLLRYDRAFPPSRRRLRITGWIPVLEDPLKLGSQQLQVPTPWLEVSGMETVSATLIISSASRLQAINAPGLTLLTAEPPLAAGGTDSRARQTYCVEDPAKLGSLQWSSAPPRVNVLIESQITIHPDSAEWVAVLRYDVAGGALDSIHLKLPTTWAMRAQVDLAGGKFRHRFDPLGPFMFWKLTPERAVWGSQRVVLRSALPLLPGQELQLPEIAPLGRGVADTYLGLVYATGSTLTTGGSSGLHEIPHASRFKDEEFGDVPGTNSRAFHVQRDNWSLKVQIPPATDDAGGTAKESARVVSADVNVTMLPDRSLQGRAVYETQAHTGRFLLAELSPESTLLWTTVDQSPTAPLRSSEGRWLIPLGEQGPCRVSLFWSATDPVVGSTGSGWSLILPSAGVGRVSTLVTLHLPDHLTIKPSLAGLELTVPDRMELERADRIARQITEFIAQIDRSSGRDRERATALLIAHEMSLRSAERSLRWSARVGDRTRQERAERDLEVIQSTRKALLETLRAAAMDDEIDAARNYFGLATKSSAGTLVAVPEPAGPDRLRNLGRPSFLIGLSSGLNEQPTKINGSFENASSIENETPDRSRSTLMLGLLMALGLTAVARLRPATSNFLILIGLLGMLGFVGGPAAVAAGLALTAGGWASRPRHQLPPPGASPPSSLYSPG